jgi:hypothetical protein
VYPSRQLEGLFLATINNVKAPEKKRKKSYQTDSQSFDFNDDDMEEEESSPLKIVKKSEKMSYEEVSALFVEQTAEKLRLKTESYQRIYQRR